MKAIPKSAKVTRVDCAIFAKTSVEAREVEVIRGELSRDIHQIAARQRRYTQNQEPLWASACSVTKQEEINRLVKDHLRLEMKLGAEINPAARIQHLSQDGKEDDDCECKPCLPDVGDILQMLIFAVCRGLENWNPTCGANSNNLLDW
jgi:hypothetical protein